MYNVTTMIGGYMPIPTTTMRLDEKAKKDAKKILDELGLNLSSATNLFLKAIVRKGGIPFELQLSSPNFNFIDEYVAPIMSERNKINRFNLSLERIKNQLNNNNKKINIGRRTVFVEE